MLQPAIANALRDAFLANEYKTFFKHPIRFATPESYIGKEFYSLPHMNYKLDTIYLWKNEIVTGGVVYGYICNQIRNGDLLYAQAYTIIPFVHYNDTFVLVFTELLN